VSQPPPYRNQARSVGRSPGWLTRTPRATAPLLSAAGAARRALGVAAAAAAAGAKGRPASLTLAARAAAAGGWSSLEEACAAQAAAVGTAAARHGTESEQVRTRLSLARTLCSQATRVTTHNNRFWLGQLAELVQELGGMCGVWETVGKDARSLAKQALRPWSERWSQMLVDAASEDRSASRQKYDGHKRAARAAQGQRKVEM
jgi:hypothetical protein